MPDRGKIPISEGKRLSEQYSAPIIVVFSILDAGDTFNVMTYGASKALCRHAASIGEQIAEKVLNGSITPEQIEPIHLPDGAINWEGHHESRGSS